MELQEYIHNTENYLQELKKHKIFVQRNRGLALLKTYRNNEYDYDKYPWIRYCRGAIIDTEKSKVICVPPLKSIQIKDINNAKRYGVINNISLSICIYLYISHLPITFFN